MKSLKIGITLLSMLAIVSFSNAQSSEAKVEKIIAELNLNADQSEQVRALHKKYKPLIENAENVNEKKKYRSEVDLDIQNILTKEQYGEYKMIKAKDRKTAAARSERSKGAK